MYPDYKCDYSGKPFKCTHTKNKGGICSVFTCPLFDGIRKGVVE